MVISDPKLKMSCQLIYRDSLYIYHIILIKDAVYKLFMDNLYRRGDLEPLWILPTPLEPHHCLSFALCPLVLQPPLLLHWSH